MNKNIYGQGGGANQCHVGFIMSTGFYFENATSIATTKILVERVNLDVAMDNDSTNLGERSEPHTGMFNRDFA